MTATVLYISTTFLGAVGGLLIASFAGNFGLLDHPNERSSHSDPTPKGGGIGILGAFVLVSALASFPPIFWGPVVFIAVIGFLNDILDFSPKLRLPFQVAAGGVFAIGALNNPMLNLSGFFLVAWIVLATIFIVGTANFYNFMDGINGIAAISGIVGFGLLALYLDITDGNSPLKLLALGLATACAGFLPFNFPGAKVFMGDVGSLLLGFLFGGMAVSLAKTLLDFICLASFLFPFYADELTTMAVRIKDRENLLHPHRRHLYQLLANEKGISHWKISVLYGFMQLSIGVSVIFSRSAGWFIVLILLGIYFSAFAAASYFLRSFQAQRAVSATQK
jgi:Fuc2NAc and GlcNAc transferase